MPYRVSSSWWVDAGRGGDPGPGEKGLMAAVHVRANDPDRELALLPGRRSGESGQERDGLVDLEPELLLVDDGAGDRQLTGHLLLGQRFGAGQPFLEPRDGGGVARILVGMRPAEITDATRPCRACGGC